MDLTLRNSAGPLSGRPKGLGLVFHMGSGANV